MADPQTPNPDSSRRVREILANLTSTVNDAVEEIHKIAKQEIESAGEDALTGEVWYSFASESQFSDIGRAATAIVWQIAAVRGQMVYRSLDSSQKNDVPPTAMELQQES